MLEAQALESAAHRVIESATVHRTSLATAESLTGGMLGEKLCSVPGASAVYQGGVISYALSVKEHLLGVSGELLRQRGAVNEDVAIQMAQGAIRSCGAVYGVSTTGVAGPEPHGGQPVGTVWIGVAGPCGAFAVEKHYEGDRQEIRELAAYDALELLGSELRKISG